MIIIIMGVSGSGKTTIGKLLSSYCGIPFFDADDFHSQSNILKMRSGIPLSDDDRRPWLKSLSENLLTWNKYSGAIVACSALKQKYRIQLANNLESIQWVYLSGSFELIYKRLRSRTDHYMKSDMLISQFQDLEEPEHAIKIEITEDPKQIVQTIMSKLGLMNKSDFGVIGLGVMGQNISLNIAEKGIPLSVYNRIDLNEEKVVSNFLSTNPEYNIDGFTELPAFVNSLRQPRKILLMIKAGIPVDELLNNLTPLLSPGDIIIDGGNSHFKDTNRRYKQLNNCDLYFIGSGISGGEEGARKGPSIMPGGNAEAYDEVSNILKEISAKDENGFPCCTHIGPEGSGHFVKMIHNGIEYAEMQLIAELYALLRKSMDNEAISKLFGQWLNGPHSSYLLEITTEILLKKEGDSYLLDLILDRSGNKGTGAWSSMEAFLLGTPSTMIVSAVFERYVSSLKEQREVLSHSMDVSNATEEKFDLETLSKAYAFGRLINHHQGFEILRIASEDYNWDLNFSEIARIWTNGCIIRSDFMKQCVQLFKSSDTLLKQKAFVSILKENEPSTLAIIHLAHKLRVSLPCLNSAFQYWLSITTENLPANLIQAQRDYFGAHRYQRIDKSRDQTFHTNWNE